MKFYSELEWKFIQALARRDFLAVQEVLEEDEFNLEKEIHLLDEVSLSDEEYEVDIESIDTEIFDFLNNFGCRNYTPLTLACYMDSLELVKILVRKGSDVNAVGQPDNSRSALDISILNGNTELAIYLLNCGADPNFISADGCCDSWNSIQTTIWQKNEEVLNAIVANDCELAPYLDDLALYGFNRHIRAVLMNWQTRINIALHSAKEANNIEAINLLLEAGADPKSDWNYGIQYVSSSFRSLE